MLDCLFVSTDTTLMNEQAFHVKVDTLFLAIEEWLEKSNEELDFESQEGILTLFLPSGQVILSRQAPLKEIWLASRQGAYHFRWSPQGWVTAKQESLLSILEKILKQEGYSHLNIAEFPLDEG